MTRLRNFKTVALLIVLAAAATLAAAPGDGAIPITTDPLGMDAAIYASDYGVTLEEAKRRLGLQGSAGALQAELLGNESDKFAGLWIQHEPDFKIVVRFTQDGESTVTPYVTGGPLSGIVEVRTADATLNDLKTAQANAMTIARGFGIRVESQTDVIENRVKLFVVDKVGLDSSLATSDVHLPDKVDVVTVSELSRNTTNLYGGLTLTSAGTGKQCTSGFAVTHSDGREGITTAGHCKDDHTFNGTALDFAGSLVGGSYDVQWYEAPGFTLRNLVYDGSGNRYVYGTESLDNQTVGTYVCKYGITTEYGCGNISHTDFQPADTGPDEGCPISLCTYSATFIRVHKHNVTLSQGGDSGGPWFVGNTAYGIMTKAVEYIVPGEPVVWDGVYMAVDYFSGLDLTVLTQ